MSVEALLQHFPIESSRTRIRRRIVKIASARTDENLEEKMRVIV